MKYVPHDYQTYASSFIIKENRSALFLECGLGKSVITLTAINDLMLDCFTVSKVLVIAPLRVANNTWSQEISKWDHLKHLKHTTITGTAQERMKALDDKAHVYVVNRENVDWLINKSGYRFDFDMIVIDELSSFKNHTAKRFKALLKVTPSVERIVGLTGTPASNGLMDLWAQFRLLDGGVRLEKYITHYRNKYFVPGKRNGMQIFSYKSRAGAEKDIYKQISDITISMQTTDYLTLPKLVVNQTRVSLDAEERAIYDQLCKEMIAEVKTVTIDAINATALSNKLLQMANGHIYDTDKTVVNVHDKKLDALEDLIKAANGKPVLVAYWFNSDCERIKNRFKVREIKTIHDITDWNNGNIPVGIIHPASAGHGLNLQAGGATLIWFSLTWSLELYQQTNARLYRQGQKQSVVIHHIICADTIDEDVMRALKTKTKTQDSLIEAVRKHIE